MSDTAEKLRRELEAAQRALAEAKARCEHHDAEHQAATKELEDNRSALLFMLEDLENARRKVEQAHQEWMAALDVVDDPIFLHDKNFRILRCNKAYRQCAGIPFHEIIGQPYYEIFPKAAAPLPCCLRAMEKAEEEEEEEVLVGEASYRSRAFSVHDEQGTYLYSVHTLEDITERKQAEEKLRETRDYLENLFNHANAPIIVWDPSCRITMFNHAFEHLTGRGANEVIGKQIATLFPADRKDEALSHIYQTQTDERWETVEIPILHSSGAVRTALWNSATLYSADGKSVVATMAQGQDITERKRTENALNHLNRALKTLGTVNHALVYATDEDVLLHTVCHAIAEDGYQLAWVGYVQHDANKTIKVMTHAGHEAGYLETLGMSWADNEHGQGPCSQAVRSSTTQICQNILSDPDFCGTWRNEALKYGYVSLISLPLASEAGVFGVLCVHAAEADAFTFGEISLLEEMAADLAFGVAMLRLRLERDGAMKQSQSYLGGLRDSLEDTVRAIASIVEMRDPYTAGHQVRVADLAAAIARQMGLPDEQIHGIHLAGTVHDLGKIKVPAEILSRPGKITDIEYSLIKIHPQAGYDILKGVNFPWPIAQMVLQHHERLDGSGYPQGLKGEAILLEARILSVADVVEAMSSHRPYRPGLGVEAALAEVTRQRGSQFDPAVADACLALFREQHYSFK